MPALRRHMDRQLAGCAAGQKHGLCWRGALEKLEVRLPDLFEHPDTGRLQSIEDADEHEAQSTEPWHTPQMDRS